MQYWSYKNWIKQGDGKYYYDRMLADLNKTLNSPYRKQSVKIKFEYWNIFIDKDNKVTATCSIELHK